MVIGAGLTGGSDERAPDGRIRALAEVKRRCLRWCSRRLVVSAVEVVPGLVEERFRSARDAARRTDCEAPLVFLFVEDRELRESGVLGLERERVFVAR